MPSRKIKKSLSDTRLSTYEAVVFNGTALSTEQALKLYAWNAQVSAAFFAPLHLCEVVIRNAVAEALEKKYGANWPWVNAFEQSLPNPHIGYSPRKDLINARRNMTTTGKVIPELKLVFWEKLLTARFDGRIWDQHLLAVFPNSDTTLTIPQIRNHLRGLLENVRELRNRIAHHEPIIARNLPQDFENIDTLIKHRCIDTASWTFKNQLVTPLMELKPF
ncbi:TPA: hypothetical protein KD874_004827 [Vibrio parahaemolyticus]|nr:hypothetical protein [Vibrio fluvialis]HBC3993248.1 hypothetical protein [Vibrio parahaemolyticus]